MACQSLSRWRATLEARDTLLQVLAPALSLPTFLERGPQIARALQVLRPRRPMQLIQVGEILNR
jgi:hypothetical protein